MKYWKCLFIFILVATSLLNACTLINTSTPISDEVAITIDEYLRDLTENQAFSGSVLIAKEGNILLNNGYGMADVENNKKNTSQTQFRIGSVTKQFTAMAVLILHMQKKIDIYEPVCSYIENCPDDWIEITIHQLLAHTSGIPDSWQFYKDKNIPNISYEPNEIIGWSKDAPLDFKPGNNFPYSNTNYLLLGYLIEEVSDKPYEVFLSDQIFEPLGMTDTGYILENSNIAIGYSLNGFEAKYMNPSLAYSAGGLFSTVEDLYRWDRSFYEETLVPRKLIKKIFNPFVPSPNYPYAPPYDHVHYGYGWFIGRRLDQDVAGHGGTYPGFRALIEHYPDDEISIIILSDLESSDISVTTFPSETIFK
jgi:CubicO group peptidase (beta-lactamase class C family)